MTQLDESKLKALIVGQLKISETEYRDELSLGETAAWDSLGHFQLIEMIESEFNVRFKSSEIPELKSLSMIKTAIQAKLK